jgi:hypothetical protein
MIWLIQDDALGEWSAIARLDVKLNGLTFDECLSTFTLNLRVVHKDVGLAINSDESPTFFVVEPLNGSYSHCGPPCYFFGTIYIYSGGNHNGNLNWSAYWTSAKGPNISRVA